MRKTNFKFGREPIIVVVFFALFLIYGFIVCSDYSISVDEIMERNSSLVTYKYIFPGVSDIVTDSVDFTEVSDLLQWRDRYYGAVSYTHLDVYKRQNSYDRTACVSAFYKLLHCKAN